MAIRNGPKFLSGLLRKHDAVRITGDGRASMIRDFLASCSGALTLEIRGLEDLLGVPPGPYLPGSLAVDAELRARLRMVEVFVLEIGSKPAPDRLQALREAMLSCRKAPGLFGGHKILISEAGPDHDASRHGAPSSGPIPYPEFWRSIPVIDVPAHEEETPRCRTGS